jgi:hypothetical protein
MKRIALLTALLLAPLATIHAAEAPLPVADIDAKTPASAARDGWKLSFSEEFEGQQVDTNVCNAEEEVLLSTKVASFAGKASPALEGKSMDVDYVRIYQKKE